MFPCGNHRIFGSISHVPLWKSSSGFPGEFPCGNLRISRNIFHISVWKSPDFQEHFPYFLMEEHPHISRSISVWKSLHFQENFHFPCGNLWIFRNISHIPTQKSPDIQEIFHFPFPYGKSPHFQDFSSSFPHPSLSHPKSGVFIFSHPTPPSRQEMGKVEIPSHNIPAPPLSIFSPHGGILGCKNLAKGRSQPQVSSWRKFQV